jgi:hypothetical protein
MEIQTSLQYMKTVNVMLHLLLVTKICRHINWTEGLAHLRLILKAV